MFVLRISVSSVCLHSRCETFVNYFPALDAILQSNPNVILVLAQNANSEIHHVMCCRRGGGFNPDRSTRFAYTSANSLMQSAGSKLSAVSLAARYVRFVSGVTQYLHDTQVMLIDGAVGWRPIVVTAAV